jgi:hypothetical protein
LAFHRLNPQLLIQSVDATSDRLPSTPLETFNQLDFLVSDGRSPFNDCQPPHDVYQIGDMWARSWIVIGTSSDKSSLKRFAS